MKRRYRRIVVLLALLWGVLSLLHPLLRWQLVEGLNLHGLGPSWGRALTGASVIALLFVVVASIFRPMLTAPKRDGAGKLIDPRFWLVLPVWPLYGAPLLRAALWAPAMLFAVASALALRHAWRVVVGLGEGLETSEYVAP